VLIHLWFVKSPILGKIAKQKFVCQPLAPGARTAVQSRAVAVQPAKHRKHEKTAVGIFGNMALKYATRNKDLTLQNAELSAVTAQPGLVRVFTFCASALFTCTAVKTFENMTIRDRTLCVNFSTCIAVCSLYK
jgi:hypothetical protein